MMGVVGNSYAENSCDIARRPKIAANAVDAATLARIPKTVVADNQSIGVRAPRGLGKAKQVEGAGNGVKWIEKRKGVMPPSPGA